MRTLDKLTIKNFKSIREQTLALGPLNVFIGGNGSASWKHSRQRKFNLAGWVELQDPTGA
jgi:predicted ATPase